jgi:hypothetical protein
VLRMTRTSTLRAVRVWLRASERISVRLLGMLNLCLSGRPGCFTEIGWRAEIP